MDTNRTLTAYSATDIHLSGGSYRTGWTWNGHTLHHPAGPGITLTPTPDIAARITAAVEAAIPARTEVVTGRQMSQLDDATQAEWLAGCQAQSDAHINGWLYSSWTVDDAIHTYKRVGRPRPGSCAYDTTDMTITTGR